jgi:serine/threonine-protein kinase
VDFGSRSALPRLIGRYLVSRELGKGAMGRVLLCHDPILDRDVAVKHLRTDLPLAPEQVAPLVERMRQEARASARVSHPHLVALHDMGEDPVAGLFLVFEYVQGSTLKQRLTEGRLTPDQAARLARELGSALHYAHQAGVVHRDVKPENVMLSPTGAKVADFGIARIPDSTLTRGGSVLGTPAYSAPEAIRRGRFSPQSDQFSLAATLYEAVSGKRAFPGDDAVAVASLIANEEPQPFASLLGLDAAVDRVLLRALSKDPKQRFSSCDELGRALSDALRPQGRMSLPTLPDALHTPSPPARRGGLFAGIVVGAMLAAAAFWTVGRTSSLRSGTPSTEARVREDEEVLLPVAWLAERRTAAASPRAALAPDAGVPHAP